MEQPGCGRFGIVHQFLVTSAEWVWGSGLEKGAIVWMYKHTSVVGGERTDRQTGQTIYAHTSVWGGTG